MSEGPKSKKNIYNYIYCLYITYIRLDLKPVRRGGRLVAILVLAWSVAGFWFARAGLVLGLSISS